MPPLDVITLGTHRITNPDPGEVPFLSAASGAAWVGSRLYCVGDDQAAVAEFHLDHVAVLEALRAGEDRDLLEPGVASRIIPEVLPLDADARKEAKADFEALTVVEREHLEGLGDGAAEALRRFPNGLLLMAGSGGVSWGGTRRSTCVVYSLSEHGHVAGLPAKVSLQGLHEHLEEDVVAGELNVEGLTVHDGQLVLAQRGNSRTAEGEPAANMLIRLSLAQVVESLYTDLRIDRCEIEEARSYDLGHADLRRDGQTHRVKLDFTDVDSVTGDPHHRLVFTAAAEADEAPIKGEIAGSAVGVVGAGGELEQLVALADGSIKLEGVDARYNPTLGCIDLLLVSDADDPDVPAPLMAARLLP